ncbi:hypothetical protein ABEF95_010802 [Exophiala dermatitidis]
MATTTGRKSYTSSPNSGDAKSNSDDLSLYILTFNCGRTPVQPEVFAPYLFSALNNHERPPEVLVLCLQELAPIAYAFLGGSFLTPYLDAFREVVRLACKRFDLNSAGLDGGGGGAAATDSALPSYVNVVTRNLGLTAIMVFARADVVDNIAWTRTAGVGLGVSEMGNKGAVGARLGYRLHHSKPHDSGSGSGSGSAAGDNERQGARGEDQVVQLTFVAAHLAAMEEALEQRNEDYKNIVQRLVFVPEKKSTSKPKKGGLANGHEHGQTESEVEPLLRGQEEGDEQPLLQHQQQQDTTTTEQHRVDSATTAAAAEKENGIYSAQSYLFFAGDLNYRTSLLPPTAQDVKERFPRPTNDINDPRHFRHLLAEDQLTQQVQAGKTLHGLTEAPIEFPPTYKYSPDGKKPVILDEGLSAWPWARHRWPSWCDRIFFWQPPTTPTNEETTTGRNGRGAVLTKVSVSKYTCLPIFATSDHRPVALAAKVPLQPVRVPLPLRAMTEQEDDNSSNVDGLGRGQGLYDHKASAAAAAAAAKAPFPIDPDWKNRRAAARNKELLVGLLAYLALTREGNGLLGATVVGALGGWLVLRSLLMA